MTARAVSPGSSPAQTRVLQAVLTAEHAAVYGYGVVGANLNGSARAAATTDWLAHQELRDTLETMLRARGSQPAAADAAYQLPIPVRTAHQAAALAAILEDRITAAYLGLVALSSPSLREFGATQVRAAALRAAAWHGSTVAFPGLPAGG
jgi:hypothetical protein